MALKYIFQLKKFFFTVVKKILVSLAVRKYSHAAVMKLINTCYTYIFILLICPSGVAYKPLYA